MRTVNISTNNSSIPNAHLGQLWISTEIFNWNLSFQGNHESPVVDFGEPYRVFNHVIDILSHHTAAPYIADAIVNLNRLVDLRLDQLEATFHFRKLTVFGSRLDRMETLQSAGIIRRRLLDAINAIRNQVEHNHAEPLSKSQTEDLAEFAWYFLRATDYMLMETIWTMTFSPDHLEHFAEVDFDRSNWWTPTIRGRLPSTTVSFERRPGWMPAKPLKFDTVGSTNQIVPVTQLAHGVAPIPRHEDSAKYFLIAQLEPPATIAQRLVRVYLSIDKTSIPMVGTAREDDNST